MALAARLGVSPRRLSGWEPSRITTHEYDDDGRPIRSVTVTEPEWDVDQVDLMLAWEAYRGDLGQYGEMLSEATSPDADPTSYSGWRYVAQGPFTNQAEKVAKDAEADWKRQAGKDANTNGMYWTVEKVEY